ncbi:response regulator transcription factor [Deferribacter abyssi]|uniref:response regulator transcription factor n=1 Tax=Deferribacter abyssi TaxID=213806 RepID=UPI003C1771CB
MKKILIAEDSATEREIMKKALEAEGFIVVPVEDGNKAIEEVKKNNYDLVILDVIMPGKNGYQVCREIKKDELIKDIPVIIVTSKGQESDKFWGKKQGADEYIVKPFNIDEFIKTVKRFL